MGMKELTKKFRENFERFDYSEDAIDVLLVLMDTILEMLTMTDYGDSAVCIKKLSSFLNLVSAEFCKDILNLEMVKAIYNVQILPILNYFDRKYDKESSKGAIRLAKQLLDDSEHRNPLESFLNDEEIEYDQNEIDNVVSFYNYRYGEGFNKLHPINLKSYNDKALFTALKCASEEMSRLYEYLSMDDYDKEKVLRKLEAIQFSSDITKYHRNPHIQALSQKIYKLCEIMLSIIDTGGTDIAEPVSELVFNIFRSINDQEYLE